jgi:hypothetical protein
MLSPFGQQGMEQRTAGQQVAAAALNDPILTIVLADIDRET